MILVMRLLAVIFILGIVFFIARKTISQGKIEKTGANSFRSLLGTILITITGMLVFVIAAEILTRIWFVFAFWSTKTLLFCIYGNGLFKDCKIARRKYKNGHGRGAGVVERGGLENRWTFTGSQGSNPCLSAI